MKVRAKSHMFDLRAETVGRQQFELLSCSVESDSVLFEPSVCVSELSSSHDECAALSPPDRLS